MLQSWKLSVNGECATEEEAIKELSDRYMTHSKCSPPMEHPSELLTGNVTRRDVTKIGKSVLLSVFEEVYGINQWIEKHHLTIYPFKKSHWWESEKGFEFTETEFRYDIEAIIPVKTQNN